MRSLKGKGVVITGASRGIGEAIARLFAAEGARLVISSRSGDALKQVAKTLHTPETPCYVVPADVTRKKDITRLIDRAYQYLGAVDIFINNAGFGVKKPLLEITEKEYDQIFNTNLRAIYYCFKELLPRMTALGFGHIINISSSAGRTGQPGLSVYGATKAALNVFSEAVATEVRDRGIKISVIAPGSTDTRLMWEMTGESPAAEKGLVRLRVEEVAETVVFVAKQNGNAWTTMTDVRPLTFRR